MAQSRHFAIILDGNQIVYRPGDVIVGHVHLELREEIKVRELHVTFEGEGYCRFKRFDRYHRGYERYAHGSIQLVRGNEQTGDPVIPSGLNQYPFQFQVPYECPGSYEAPAGHVRYAIWAVLSRPWAVKETCFVILTVLTALDLNYEPNVRDFMHAQNTGTSGSLCCAAGPVAIDLSLDKKGYVPGESIPVRAEINNMGSKPIIAVCGDLIMTTTYHARGTTTAGWQVITRVRRDKPLRSGETDVWDRELIPIPPLPPSYLRKSNIIDIKYTVMIRTEFTGLSFEVNAGVEVIIGTVPLAQAAQAATQVYPSAPPPSYSLYEFGTCTNITEPSKDGDGDGEVNTVAVPANFAPSYEYYNFSQHQESSSTMQEKPPKECIELKQPD